MIGDYQNKNEDYRNSIQLFDNKGKRIWIYAVIPYGNLYFWRAVVAIVLVGLFFLLPHLTHNGHPLFMLNVIERKFILFGKLFTPSDFYIFFLIMVSFMVFIILFTVVYGRIWCGWLCPQTMFMEIFFRNIEYLIEGNASRRKKRDQGPLNFDKILRKLLKHIVFMAFSLTIGFGVLAYLKGGSNLRVLLNEGFTAHTSLFTGWFVLSGVIFLVFSQLRELACTVVCPYGRLQGALIDTNSIVVSYDYQVGEQRAPFVKNENRKASGKGNCVACNKCVTVCPTGIDIRNGAQFECINCGACIDACNSVMKRTQQPKGLIKYASAKSIAENSKWKLSWRMIAYSVLLLLIVSFLTGFLLTRNDIQTNFTRAANTMFQNFDSVHVSNIFEVQITNKSYEDQTIELKVLNFDAKIMTSDGSNTVNIGKEERLESICYVIINKKDATFNAKKLKIGVYSNNNLIETKEVQFIYNFYPKN